jgi:Ca2+-binding RTX toxin-like protein
MAGGAGDDTYYVDNIGDTVSEWAGQGYDTVRSSLTHTLSNNVEKFVATGTAVLDGTGNGLNNVMTGNGAANRLNGEAGNDRLWGTAGNDALSGGGGNDWLVGGMGRDTLIGGLGRDVFDFNSGSESPASGNRDVINDFTAGDRIDLSGIDADASQVGNQAFTSLGTGALFPGTFAMAGELYYDATSQILHGNTDADAQADFSIRVRLSGLATLILADLAL